MKQRNLFNTGDISSDIGEQTRLKKDKNGERDGFLSFQEKERLKNQRPVSLI